MADLTVTSAVDTFMGSADQTAMRTNLGLGTLATLSAAPAGTLTGTTLAATVITSSLTAIGTIATGVWQGTAITDTYISSAATWNSKQAGATNLTSLSGLSYVSASFVKMTAAGTFALDTNVYRSPITGTTVYYVRTDGSDSNTGLVNNAGGAFLTIQKAINTAYALDTMGQQIVIQVADGTYSASVNVINGPLVGGNILTIKGNATTPSNVVVSATGSDVFNLAGSYTFIQGMKLSSATSGTLIRATQGTFVILTKMEYGSSAEYHLSAESNSTIFEYGTATISGSAVAFIHSTGASVFNGTATYTLTGTPAFSAYFAGCAGFASITFSGTFSGSATGKRFLAHNFGAINVGSNSATYLPGSTAGEASDFGTYVGTTTLSGIPSNCDVGIAGTSTGIINFQGATSGAVTMQAQAAAGTYNFNLPTSAGTDGDFLTTAGGGASAMTWGHTAKNGLILTGGSYVAGSVYYSAALGTVMVGKAGSFSDLMLGDITGANAFAYVPTGTRNWVFAGTLTLLGGATFLTTSSALTDGAGVAAGTLLNAPAAGNPTKWIGINDNGTVRYIPAW